MSRPARRHRPRLLEVGRLVALLSLAPAAWSAQPADAPPTFRYLVSPSGEYKLTIEVAAGDARATLQRLRIPNEVLWAARLPHESGPRIGFVGDTGIVVLFDEWGASGTEHALTLINPDGTTLARYATADVAALAQLDTAALTGVPGSWPHGRPRTDGGSVVVPMGHVDLLIDLATGAVSTRRHPGGAAGAGRPD